MLAVAAGHPGTDCAAVGHCPGELNLEPVAAALDIVAQQRRGLVQIHDQDVDIPIVVKIAKGTAPTRMSQFDCRPGLRSDPLQPPLTEVAEHHIGGLEGVLRQLRFNLRVDVPGCVEDVRPAVVVKVHDARAPADVADFDRQAGLHGAVLEAPGAIVDIEDVGVVGEVRLEDVQIAAQAEIRHANTHPGLLLAVFVKGHTIEQPDLFERAVVLVAKQQAGGRIASYVDIRPAVVVVVRRSDGHAVAGSCSADSSFVADLAEGPVAIVAVERMPRERQPSRAAVDLHSLPVAVPHARTGHGIKVEVAVI